MNICRAYAIATLSLLIITYANTSQAQTLNKKALIEHIEKATRPVATTDYDGSYNAHFADLTIAKEMFAQADTSILPSATSVLDDWNMYESSIKTAFRERESVSIHILQTYTSMDTADRRDMIFSKVLAEKMLEIGNFTTVAVDRLWSDSLTINETISQTLSFLDGFDSINPSDSAQAADMLMSLDPAVSYYSSGKKNVHLVGASSQAVANLSKQIMKNGNKITPLDLYDLKSSLAAIKAEMAIAKAINAAVENGDNRVALVVDGSMGASLYEIADQRGYKTRLYWSAKRSKKIEEIFRLKK
jgi:hypothetical protein